MTVARDPDRQCRGKNTYSTKAEAKSAIRNMQTVQGRTVPGRLTAYRCPHCGSFHFGHVSPALKALLRGEEL